MTAAPAPMIPFGRIGYLIAGAPPDRVIAVGEALEARLAKVGWTPVASPNAGFGVPEGVQMQRGRWRLDVRARLAEVAMHVKSPEQWQYACRVAGIDAVQIELPALQAGGPWEAQPASDPGAETSGERRKGPRELFLGVLALALIAIVFPMVRDHFPAGGIGSNSTSGAATTTNDNYIAVDGKSDLLGGYVTARYAPTGYDWESIQPPTNEDGPNDAAQWWLGQYVPGSMLHFGIDHRIWKPSIRTRKDVAQFLTVETSHASDNADGRVETGKTRVGGRKAHFWQYTSKDGKLVSEVWVLGSVHSFMFACSNDQPAAANVKVGNARCDDFLRSVKFHVSN